VKIRVETNTKALGSLYTGLSSIASGEVARKANSELASIYQGFVDRSFATGRGPYGDPWAPPKDGGRPGYRTGDLSRDAKVRPAGNRILLSTSLDYAKYFVRSGRDIFPNASDGVPVKWKEAADRVHRKAVRGALKVR
jgi:hypothetical protein